jgi:siroheme synthase
VARRIALASQLIERGWSRRTPAAVVADGTRPTQQVWRGSLGDLAAGRVEIESDAPAVIVVGDVAGLDLRAGTEAVSTPDVGAARG